MIIVADTGPILHLHWVGAATWAWPPQPVSVVDEVWREVERHAPEALRDSRLQRVSRTAALSPLLSRFALDAAECSALSFALQFVEHADVLIACDEHEARRACATLSLSVTGSIGLVIEAARAGRVTPAVAARALRELPERGRLHIRADVIQRAIDALPAMGLR